MNRENPVYCLGQKAGTLLFLPLQGPVFEGYESDIMWKRTEKTQVGTAYC